jgi:hypothetical protein
MVAPNVQRTLSSFQATLIEVGSTTELDALAAKAALDTVATYINTTTGLRYWATSPTAYAAAGTGGTGSAAFFSGATYDGSAPPRLTGFVRGAVTYTVAYPTATTVTITGTDGSAVTVLLDGGGRVLEIV